jgi:hypothetical protein
LPIWGSILQNLIVKKTHLWSGEKPRPTIARAMPVAPPISCFFVFFHSKMREIVNFLMVKWGKKKKKKKKASRSEFEKIIKYHFSAPKYRKTPKNISKHTEKQLEKQ